MPHVLLTLTALLSAVSASAIAQTLGPRQPSPPVQAVAAAPSKYDFEWEQYAISVTRGGTILYIFQQRQPVAVAGLEPSGTYQILPIVSGRAAEELTASLERFKRAKRRGGGPLSITLVSASSKPSALLAASHDTERSVNPDRIHIALKDGTTVDLSPLSIDVVIASALPNMPGTRIRFTPFVNAHIAGPASNEVEIVVNGMPITWQRKGPLWDGLKGILLLQALGKAAEAAHIYRSASGGTHDPDYIATIAGIERGLK